MTQTRLSNRSSKGHEKAQNLSTKVLDNKQKN